MNPDDALNVAIEHHRNGRLAKAEQIYRQVLQQHPNHPVALYFLGRIAASSGHLEHAAKILTRAASIDSTNADCLGILGEVLAQLKRPDDAIAAYRAAAARRPDWVEVQNNLAKLLLDADRMTEAIDAYQAALRHRPDHAETHSNLAEAFRIASRLPEALDAAQTAIRLKPDLAAAHGVLGNALYGLGRFDEALAAQREAIRLDPKSIDAWSNLALALSALRRREEAVDAYRQALNISPNPAAAQIYTNLGATYLAMSRLDDAIDAYREAIRLEPNLVVAAYNNLGTALREQGLLEDALAAYRRAIGIDPDFGLAHSNLLFTMHFHPDVTNEQVLAAHRAWAARQANVFTPANPLYANSRDPDRRLRLGFVSPDLKDHPLGRFLLTLLEALDRTRIEATCYSATARTDDITRRLREHSAAWREVRGMTPAALADTIRRDAIDVLIDLSLHSAGNALLAFALKPAPVQITYLGYPGTSGMAAMDFRLTDPYLDPPGGGADANYTECSLRLPRTYWCYAPPGDAPDAVAPPPGLSTGQVTFGCLNQFSKASAPARQAWARILASVPGSRLILHSLPGRHRARIVEEFSRAGVDAAADRIEWVDKLPMRDYFLTCNRIDIALDPFPYNGGTTTCDMLWMGVPVVTLAGQRAVARAGVSILSNLALAELIARDVDEYVHIASELSRDAARLSQMRATMRARMRASPLMDAETFARDFERVIRDAWREWCGGTVGGGSVGGGGGAV